MFVVVGPSTVLELSTFDELSSTTGMISPPTITFGAVYVIFVTVAS